MLKIPTNLNKEKDVKERLEEGLKLNKPLSTDNSPDSEAKVQGFGPPELAILESEYGIITHIQFQQGR